MMDKDKKNLIDFIMSKPDGVFWIDNDCWGFSYDDESIDYIPDCNFDAPKGDGGYGSGSCYGGDILQSLAQIVGIKVESV